MKLNKDDIYGIAGSVAFHLFILLILGFTVLKTVVPDEDGGILVNFGNVNAAAGTFEPKYTGQEPPQETTPPPPPVPEPKVETPKEDLVTQEIEESVAIEEAKKKKEIMEIMDIFNQRDPNPRCELDYQNAYTLLVAVVLSAQATDKGVNKATKALFAVADTPQKMLALGIDKLKAQLTRIVHYAGKQHHRVGALVGRVGIGE